MAVHGEFSIVWYGYTGVVKICNISCGVVIILNILICVKMRSNVSKISKQHHWIIWRANIKSYIYAIFTFVIFQHLPHIGKKNVQDFDL